MTLEDAPAQLVIETTLAQRVRDLAAEEPERRAARDNAAAELARATDERDDAQARLDAVARLPEDTVLRAGHERVRAAGDLSRELEQAQERLGAVEAEAANLMDQLGLTGVELFAVPDLAVPAPATVERYRTELDATLGEVTRLQQAVAMAEDERKRVRAELAELVATADPPTETDLEQRRVERDELWARIRATWLSGARPGEGTTPDVDAVGGAVGEAVGEADRYESAVTEADAVADRLRREADAVARRASLQTQDALLQDQLGRDTEQLEARRADHAGMLANWRAEWEPIGVKPGTPSEMTLWLAEFAKLQDRARQAARLNGERSRRAEKIDEHRRELLAGLATAGRSTAGADGEEHLSLEAVVDLARRTPDDAEGLRRKREALEEELKRLAAIVRDRSAAADRASVEYATWQEAWRNAMERLGLPPDTTPSEALAFLADAERLAGHLRAAKSSRERLEQIDGYLQDYTERLRAVVNDVAPDLADREPLSALDQLVERLDDAVEADVTARELVADLEELGRQRHQHEVRLVDAARRLERLLEEAGVPDEPALRDAIERSDRLRGLEADRKDLERAIVEQSDGITAEELEAALAGRDEVALRTELDELSDQLSELEDRISERDTRLGALPQEHARLDGSAAAADAAAEVAFRSAEIEQLTKEYVSVALAGELLRHHIAAYRDQHQAPILQRAVPWFSKLTCGRFSRLDTDVDDKDAVVLEGVGPNGERVGVGAMSEGTCDQLYLALRLAALAEAADSQEPFPLVLDDVLITFDDDRSRAALEILGELSGTYQVLMFTHHDHLRDLAVEVLGDRVTCHELQPRDLSLPAAVRSGTGWTASSGRSAGRGASNAQHRSATAVLEVLRVAEEPLGKSELLERAGIDEAAWSSTIKALVDRGDVVKLGDRRGARYQLASADER